MLKRENYPKRNAQAYIESVEQNRETVTYSIALLSACSFVISGRVWRIGCSDFFLFGKYFLFTKKIKLSVRFTRLFYFVTSFRT